MGSMGFIKLASLLRRKSILLIWISDEGFDNHVNKIERKYIDYSTDWRFMFRKRRRDSRRDTENWPCRKYYRHLGRHTEIQPLYLQNLPGPLFRCWLMMLRIARFAISDWLISIPVPHARYTKRIQEYLLQIPKADGNIWAAADSACCLH